MAVKINKKIAVISGIVVCILVVGFLAVLTTSNESKPPRFKAGNIPQNNSPLNPTSSPTLAQAHQKEVEWLKAHGQFFEFGQVTETKKTPPPKPEYVSYEAPPASPPPPPRINMAKVHEEQILWRQFYDTGGKLAGEGAMLDVEYSRGASGPMEKYIEGMRLGCPVKGTVLRSALADMQTEAPLVVKITEAGNCANLPVGTLVTASLHVNYSTFRARGEITGISLPDGEFVPAKGYVLGPDGVDGVGYRVIRNDRKGVAFDALTSGIAEGLSTVAETPQNVEMQCYEWGCTTIQEDEDLTLKGVTAGIGGAFDRIAEGIRAEYGKISPIVITVPQNFPVEVVFEG